MTTASLYAAPQEPDELEAKLVLLGPPDAGKSSLAIRYTRNMFDPRGAPTIGASFFQKGLQLHGAKIRLNIWDTAGQERFRAMGPMYYRNAKAAVVVVDVTQPGFDANVIKKWVASVRGVAGNGIALAVAANKCDLKPPQRCKAAAAPAPVSTRPARPVSADAAAGSGSGTGTGAGSSSSSSGRRFGEELSGNANAAPVEKTGKRRSSKGVANPAYAVYKARLQAISDVAAEVGANLYECSAKSGHSVSQIFSDVARALLIEWKTQEERRKRARRSGGGGGAEAAAGRAEGKGVTLFKRHNSFEAGGAGKGGSCAC